MVASCGMLVSCRVLIKKIVLELTKGQNLEILDYYNSNPVVTLKRRKQ